MDKIKFNKDLLDKNGQPFATRADDSNMGQSGGLAIWDSNLKQFKNSGFDFQDFFLFLHYLTTSGDKYFHVYPTGITTVESPSSGKSYIPNFGTVTAILLPTSVTEIADDVFDNASWLKKVIIPNGVTCIGNNAFNGCRSLKNDSKTFRESSDGWLHDYNILPSTLRIIGENAFKQCTSLTTIAVPASVELAGASIFEDCLFMSAVDWYSFASIPANAFRGCSRLTNVKFFGEPLEIGANAFERCSNLSGITLPQNLLTIGTSAFMDTPLLDVYIPYTVEEIGEYAFQYTGGPSNSGGRLEFGVGSHLASIGKYAFDGAYCSNGTLDIPSSVQDIGDAAFRGTGFTCVNFELPFDIGVKTVENIPHFAFQDCELLEQVNLPYGVSNIGVQAFMYCRDLYKITFDNEPFDNTSKRVRIPDSVTSIGAQAFAYTAIEKVSIASTTSLTYSDDGVEQPSTGIFEGCSLLTHAEFRDEGVGPSQPLPENTFRDCGSLVSCILPNECTGIGTGAFAGCGSLATIRIPNSVNNISNGAFKLCRTLKVIDVSMSTNDWYQFVAQHRIGNNTVNPLSSKDLYDWLFDGPEDGPDSFTLSLEDNAYTYSRP